jgi:hypothetical protein
VIVAQVAVVVIMVEQTLTHVSVVTIVVTRFNKVVQAWVQVLQVVQKHLDRLKHQSKYKLADLTHRQSLDIFNGISRIIKGT